MKGIRYLDVERFWLKMDKRGACWIWSAVVDKDGYGKHSISFPRKSGQAQKQVHLRAHRLAFFLRKGAIPAGAMVIHSCDTPACCNPKHLRLGTQLENRADAKRRGRTARGERHPKARITESQAREIIRLKRRGVPCRVLAARYGIGKSTAQQVGTLYWMHLV